MHMSSFRNRILHALYCSSRIVHAGRRQLSLCRHCRHDRSYAGLRANALGWDVASLVRERPRKALLPTEAATLSLPEWKTPSTTRPVENLPSCRKSYPVRGLRGGLKR